MPLLRKRIHFWLTGVAGSVFLRAFSATWRLRVVDPHGMLPALRAKRAQGVFAFWHRHILTLMCGFRDYDACVPVSEHRDGEFVAQVMERYGYLAVRGSTTRGSLGLIRGLLKAVAEGRNCVLTPDGPRGPKFSVQPGFVLLARRTGLPVWPIGVAVDRAWELGSWDAFVVPKPGTRSVVVLGEMIPPERIQSASTEALCEELREKMMRATELARRELGTGT